MRGWQAETTRKKKSAAAKSLDPVLYQVGEFPRSPADIGQETRASLGNRQGLQTSEQRADLRQN